MLKYLNTQMNKCEQSLRKQLFSQFSQGRLAFVNDIQLFQLITSAYDIRTLSGQFSIIIPGLKHLLFSSENPFQVIGFQTKFFNEKILFLNVSFCFFSIEFLLFFLFRKFNSKEIFNYLPIN